jgi:hypothetical protein
MNDICINPTEQSVLNRPNTDKFILVLNLPQILRDNFSTKEKKTSITSLEISVFGAVVPQIEVPPVPVPYGGQTYNVTSITRPNYAPLEVNFVVDNQFTNYFTLWRWLAALNDPKKSIYTGKQGEERKELIKKIGLMEYETTVSLFGLNEYNKAVIEFTYYNCFIIGLGSINYNYRENTPIDSSFKLQYSQFDVKLLS